MFRPEILTYNRDVYSLWDSTMCCYVLYYFFANVQTTLVGKMHLLVGKDIIILLHH